MTDVRQRLADALREHQQGFGGCECGWRYPNPTIADQDGHLADVLLSLPDIAIVGRAHLSDSLYDAWDAGNATGLDGLVGPGRGTEPIDDQARYNRDRDVALVLRALLAAANAAELLTPQGDTE
jgi:hypothetical protein